MLRYVDRGLEHSQHAWLLQVACGVSHTLFLVDPEAKQLADLKVWEPEVDIEEEVKPVAKPGGVLHVQIKNHPRLSFSHDDCLIKLLRDNFHNLKLCLCSAKAAGEEEGWGSSRGEKQEVVGESEIHTTI